MEKKTKVFAFKLAEKAKDDRTESKKWKAREGVSIAGCSDAVPGQGMYRCRTWGGDDGAWC